MTTYMRESDNVEMLEVAPGDFVNANYLEGHDIIADESASQYVDHPRNRALHDAAARIRAINVEMGFNPTTKPDWNW